MRWKAYIRTDREKPVQVQDASSLLTQTTSITAGSPVGGTTGSTSGSTASGTSGNTADSVMGNTSGNTAGSTVGTTADSTAGAEVQCSKRWAGVRRARDRSFSGQSPCVTKRAAYAARRSDSFVVGSSASRANTAPSNMARRAAIYEAVSVVPRRGW